MPRDNWHVNILVNLATTAGDAADRLPAIHLVIGLAKPQWAGEPIVQTEAELDQQHLISLNIANGRKKVESPHPDVSIFNFHYCVPPDVVAMNHELARVIGENETGFRGSDDLLYRTEAWAFLLAGGAPYNNLDYSFAVGHEDGTFAYPATQPGGGNPGLRRHFQQIVLADRKERSCKDFFD